MEEQASENPKPATLDLLFELARVAPEGQIGASTAVDAKIQTVAAGGVLIGLGASGNVRHDIVTAVFASLAVVAFLVVAAVAIWALWSRKYRLPMSPQQLWDRYCLDEPYYIKHAFVADVAEGYVENRNHLIAKHKALRIVLIALLVETTAIGTTLIATAAQS